ncbi:MAG: cytochrome c3 family protein, partial [Limisphaerales bacterium]
ELIRTGGDTSGFDCYACHDRGKKIELKFDELGIVIPPEDHDDMVFKHGRHGRNDNCLNCHDANNLDKLRTRDGLQLKFDQSNLLCASCHGPTYRDWEIGIHGRTSGYWDRTRGEATRLDCTSCHDPHAPAFPKLKPAPGPVLLHEKDRLILERLKGDVHVGKPK